jgi:hypothetical protein
MGRAMIEPSTTIFLLSPANLGGQRARTLLNPTARFPLAQHLRTEGATIADAFSFVSGLYFRGKVAYARRFGRAPEGNAAALVMTAGGGLCPLDEVITVERLQRWAGVAIHHANDHFTAPMIRHAHELLDVHDEQARFVLLGSVATQKYVRPLLEVFGDRLLFPADFAGRGDMARGSLMLRAADAGRELAYVEVETALQEGAPSRGRLARLPTR